MKKIAIIVSFFALLIHVKPVMAYDKNGYGDDPVYDWGAGSDDVVITGTSSDDDFDPFSYPPWQLPDEIELPPSWYDYWAGYYGSNPGGGGPGNGNNSTGSIIPAGQNSLSAEAKALLEQILSEMLAEYCAYQAMLNYTSADAAEFSDVQFSSDVLVGGYNPCTDVLLFNNINSIREAFPEEFIHFFQDSYYQNNYQSGGICRYLGTNAQNNIEFEAKLIQDLINYIAIIQGYSTGGGNIGAGPNLGGIYSYWINYLTNGGTSMPTSEKLFESFQSYNYWNFMNDWANGYLNGVQIDPNFFPQSIGFLSGSCD
ncbi:hypothetical protein FACS189446_3330 [Bacteroidia bacterium]|nr:hypothetical protein FACS189446_3330 [Bacteroidia bacterium]